jgi:hypothetical protein
MERRDKQSARTLAAANQIGAFFREGPRLKRDLAADALPAGGQLPLEAPRCPFSAQRMEKTDAKNPQVN